MLKNLPIGTQTDVLIEPRTFFNEKELKEILKKCGLKITKQRVAVLKVLSSGPRYHKTAKDILEEVKKNFPNIGFATIYRLLKRLSQAQMILEISMGAGSSCYELKTKQQSHYHIACLNCGKIIEFKNKMIETTLEKIVLEKNYTLKNQVVEIYVNCDSCKNQ
ncbi:MAG: transcriptional repressor [Bdellovibrionales bacterium]|nr:transcriptional repressor [Bdellovibrionales bacterium]